MKQAQSKGKSHLHPLIVKQSTDEDITEEKFLLEPREVEVGGLVVSTLGGCETWSSLWFSPVSSYFQPSPSTRDSPDLPRN